MRDSDRETVAAFDALLAMERDGGRRAILTEKREVYAKRADKLERLALDVTPKPPTPSPPSPPSPKPLNPLPTPASNELDDLTAEIENLLSRMKVVKEKWEKKALGQKVEALLARAEKLKGPVDVVSPAKPPVKPTSKPTAKPASPTRSSSASTLAVRPSPGKPSPTRSSPTSNSLSPSQSIPSLSNLLTASEIAVLRDSSRINGLLLLPWAEEDPLSLHSPDNLPAFLDPSGPLPLSAAQKTNFGSWKRPHEWLSEPILAPSAEELLAETRQETVTDCTLISPLLSMLSLLAIRNAPIPPILHPQSYSSHGKYLARLYLNGIPRTLEIDDLLPFSREAGPMFTHTPGSLWISLLEKAWMKVHGGYGYPGSGASSDFYGLLGWIPEEVYVGKHLLDDDKPDTDDLWTRILRGWKEGVCVLTAATGPNADKGSGLVPSHAYAILDLREGAGERLVKLKNPWRRKRWTGALSPSDGESWNAELWQLCGYDLWAAQESDDGIFWIRWGDLIKHFDSIHMNWDPEMFPHKWTGHLRWVPEQAGNPEVLLSENPQFEVQSSGEGWIWAFLGKHVTELEENLDYLTLHVYSGAERVYIATEPLIRGTYINSPHLLVRWRSPPDGGKFTIVVASHEQLSKEIRFSLRCFGDVPIVVREAGKLANRMQLHGEWNDQTAGGAMSSSMFYANPQFEIIVPQRTELTLVLSTPEFPVNVKLVRKKGRVSSVGKGQVVLGSGDYRHGGCVARGVVEPGTYVAIASTYEPRMFAKFRLDFYSSVSLSIREISAEGHGMHRAELRGEWVAGTSAVGCVHFRLYERNPAFEFALSKPGRVMVRLQAIMEPAPPINVAIFRLGETGWGGDEVVGSGAYTDWIQGVVTPPKKLEPGKYVFVCSTWEPTPGRFRAVFYAEESVTPVAVARVATDS